MLKICFYQFFQDRHLLGLVIDLVYNSNNSSRTQNSPAANPAEKMEVKEKEKIVKTLKNKVK